MKKLIYISTIFFLIVLATSSCKKMEAPCEKDEPKAVEKTAISSDDILENDNGNVDNGKPITDPENEDDEGLMN